MSALGSIGTALGTGSYLAGNVRQAETQNATARAQLRVQQQQQAARLQEITAQQQADAVARQQQLASTQATDLAHAASTGQVPNDGSAAAIASGAAQTSAAQQVAANSRFDAQRAATLSPSLLAPSGTLTAALQSGRSFGVLANSLLD